MVELKVEVLVVIDKYVNVVIVFERHYLLASVDIEELMLVKVCFKGINQRFNFLDVRFQVEEKKSDNRAHQNRAANTADPS